MGLCVCVCERERERVFRCGEIYKGDTHTHTHTHTHIEREIQGSRGDGADD